MRKTLFLLPVFLIAAGCGSEAEDVGTSVEITTSTTAPVASNVCVASDLEASLQNVSSPAGDFTIVLTSRDDDPCSLQGTPQVQLFDEDTAIPTQAAPETSSSAAIELNEGDRAYFDVDYEAQPVGVGETADWLYITVPGDDQSLRLPLQDAQIGSVSDDVTVTITSLRATA